MPCFTEGGSLCVCRSSNQEMLPPLRSGGGLGRGRCASCRMLGWNADAHSRSREPCIRALRMHEFRHEWLRRLRQQILELATLYHAAIAHEHDLVCEPGCLVQVVRDQHHGLAQPREDILELGL